MVSGLASGTMAFLRDDSKKVRSNHLVVRAQGGWTVIHNAKILYKMPLFQFRKGEMFDFNFREQRLDVGHTNTIIQT
jgi:hypothetical protein